MAVYVDALAKQGWWLHGRLVVSCHLVADSVKELFEFGEKIGLKREWVQSVDKPGSTPHFDLVANKRAVAVKHGAVELSLMEAGKLFGKLRNPLEKGRGKEKGQ